jgi:uncharacterized membrane protein
MNRSVRYMTQAAVIAAIYILLTMPLITLPFGLRLSEAMTVLPALIPAAVPGLFIGCLIANILNPQNLGVIDIVLGSMTTLAAAWLTYRLSLRWPIRIDKGRSTSPLSPIRLLLTLWPAVVLNGLIVGTYLPFLIVGQTSSVSLAMVVTNIAILASGEAAVIILVGIPLLLAFLRLKPRAESFK